MLHAAGTGRCPTARRLSALWIGTRLRLHSAETGVAPDRARTAWSAGRGIGGQTWPARGPRGYCWTCRSGVEVWGGVQGHAGHADRVRRPRQRGSPCASCAWGHVKISMDGSVARIGITGLPFDSVAMALDSARQVAGMSGGAVPLNWRQRGMQSTGLFVSARHSRFRPRP